MCPVISEEMAGEHIYPFLVTSVGKLWWLSKDMKKSNDILSSKLDNPGNFKLVRMIRRKLIECLI